MAAFPSQLLLSSKHRKERILQCLFEPLGVRLFTPNGFDTDAYGTFCGETPRIEGPKQTVKEKCLAGMHFANQRQGLASEGSFGPHPSIPFLTINEEILIYIDLDQDLEIYGQSSSFDVCNQHLTYREEGQLESFLERIDFGAQGLVLKNALNHETIDKGITERSTLMERMEKHPEWHIETDLRAHLNPKRQKNIIQAAQDLIDRMHRLCPSCQHPDFSVRRYSGHLNCSWCGNPTESYAFLEYDCQHCSFQHTTKRPDRTLEDPQYCQHCNP
jgi:hypothetical protein